MGSRWPSFALALVLCAGCASAPTQLIVVVDTDLALPTEADAFFLRVTRPDGTMADETELVSSRADLPLTLGIIADGGSLGPIDVAASALHGGTRVVSRSARVTLVRGETRVLRLYLVRACQGQTCPSMQTCTEEGCAPTLVTDLPGWTGTAPRLGEDAGVRDAGPRDAGDVGVRDAMPDAAVVSCASDTECDDGVDCTADRCNAMHCEHTTHDSVCEDGNPCTDGTCTAGGCVQANNTAPCDDGAFCNGTDVCMAGACTHPGDPCVAPTTCDETGDLCRGCSSRAQCPADTMGPFSSCDYQDSCDQSGMQQRTDLTYACVSGSCMATPMVVMAPCSRTTDGISCGMGSCGAFGACSYSDGCDESGQMMQTCTDLTCSGGVCRPVDRPNSAPCSRDTDGMGCGAASCGAYGACEWPDTCAQSAVRHRMCTDPTCSNGTCSGGNVRTEADPGCSRSTDGTSCGPSQVCMGGGCAACAVTLSGGFGGSYLKNVSGSGASLNLSDGNTPPASGVLSASSPVTFSGSYAPSIAVAEIHASGHQITFVDWFGGGSGIITVSGATVSGDFAPPCTPSEFGCFPPTIDSIAGSGNTIQLHASDGNTGAITFVCN